MQAYQIGVDDVGQRTELVFEQKELERIDVAKSF